MDVKKIKKFDLLLNEANEIDKTRTTSPSGYEYVDSDRFIEWDVKVENFYFQFLMSTRQYLRLTIQGSRILVMVMHLN